MRETGRVDGAVAGTTKNRFWRNFTLMVSPPHRHADTPPPAKAPARETTMAPCSAYGDIVAAEGGSFVQKSIETHFYWPLARLLASAFTIVRHFRQPLRLRPDFSAQGLPSTIFRHAARHIARASPAAPGVSIGPEFCATQTLDLPCASSRIAFSASL